MHRRLSNRRLSNRRPPERTARAMLLAVALSLLATTACSSDDGATKTAPAGFPNTSCLDHPAPCIEIEAGDADSLQEESQLLADNTTVVLAEGKWDLANQVTIRKANGVTLIGQGMDKSVLSFAGQKVQANGVDVIGDDFRIQSLRIEDAKKDALRVEQSAGVTIRKVKVTWTGGPKKENGAYGLYPVRCQDVLVESCEAWNASDAGIYVGQSERVVVRNNIAKGNVAGMEIENTQFADVYGNLSEDNTAGLAVFDLPGNPVIGRDVFVHDNIIRANNRINFAPGGTVSQIPAGTGSFILASRRVEFTNNTYENNNSVDIAVLSGLAIEGKKSKWRLANDKLVGDNGGLDLPADATGVSNYKTTDIYVHNNKHIGGGTKPDNTAPDARPLGFLLWFVWKDTPVDTLMYDGWGESKFDAADASKNSNDNRICTHDEDGGSFVNLNLAVNLPAAFAGKFPALIDLYRPKAPYKPYDCSEMLGGKMDVKTIPQLTK